MLQVTDKYAEENIDRYKYFSCMEPPTQMIRKKTKHHQQ